MAGKNMENHHTNSSINTIDKSHDTVSQINQGVKVYTYTP